jgi:CheY-like chemotaxis protein
MNHEPNRVGRPLRILIVEDDSDTAESLALLLRLQGHIIFAASDGPAAIEAAESTNPDVVLLDIGLPKMDGYEVARRLQQARWPKKPLLIAITGYGQQAERLRAYDAGIDIHLTKPVAPEELLRFLARIQTTRE